MPVNSQIILFAIQAAVRLEGQVRQAQIDRIKNHSINLLTPQFDGSVNVKSAVRWFTRSGASSIADDLELVKLVEKAEVDRRGLSDEERDRVIKEYTKIRNLDEGLVKFSGGIPKEHIFALTEVKQWEDGKNPNPSPLQRIGGSLIEIGVDYFKTTPYLANANSPQAKMLSSFLDAVDEIDFAEGQLQDIASKMMLATLEGIDSGTGFLSGDDKSNKLLKSLAKGIISDVNNFVKTEGAGNLFKQEQAKQWGQIVFKSVLSTAGETVLNNPNKFLGNGAGAEMVQSVGNCLVKGIMEDIDAGGGAIVSLKNVFTADTLDSVTKASFEVLAEHPEWQDKLRAEARALGRDQLTYEDLDNMELYELVFKETLRMNPSVSMMQRRTMKEVEIDGHKVPADTIIYLPPVYNHFMPDYWSEPEKFDPYRFAEGREEHKSHSFAYMPFGGGAHKCIGMHFAAMVAKTFMHQFVLNYDYSTTAVGAPKADYFPLPKPSDGVPLKLKSLK